MNWYVLFVRTGREKKVEQLLKKQLDTEMFMPFVPLHEIIFKMDRTVKKELKPLFPGYVFIESEMCEQEFINRSCCIVNASIDILYILRYSDTGIAMRESERQMLLRLSNDNHCIESSSGIKEGNRINIVDGPLKGLESIIRKVNRHKRQAWIEIDLMGSIRLVRVALEIAEKIE